MNSRRLFGNFLLWCVMLMLLIGISLSEDAAISERVVEPQGDSMESSYFDDEETDYEDVSSLPVQFVGRLEIFQSDSLIRSEANRFYLVHADNGFIYHLETAHNTDAHQTISSLITHSRVLVEGFPMPEKVHTHIWGPKHIVFNTTYIVELISNPSMSYEHKLSERAASEKIVNLRRMVVLIVNTNDDTVSCSVSSIDQKMWKDQFSVKGLFEANSFGQVEFAGNIESNEQWDIFGPYQINVQLSGTCDPNSWADLADAAATAAGVKFENYQHRVYVLPSKSQKVCHWEGLGWVNCDDVYCRAWVNTCDRMEVFVHELGHNVGMSHASSNLDEKGYIETYGDPTAFMGNKFFKSNDQLVFNAPHKDQNRVKWFPGNKVITVTTTGMYSISPLNLLPANAPYAQALKIYHPDLRTYYYFSYMTVRSNYSHRCLVHYHDNDTAPTMFVKALQGDGRYYEDPNSRFTVTQWSVDNLEMKLLVVFNCLNGPTLVDFFAFQPVLNAPFSAYNQDPSITWNSSIAIDVESGGGVTLTLRVANTDSPLCRPVTYTLTPSVPQGWSVGLTPNLLLTPGQTCFIEYTINTSSSSVPGIYHVDVEIVGVSEDGFTLPEHSTNISATINLASSCLALEPSIAFLNTKDYFIPGEEQNHVFTIQNNDLSSCEATTFNFATKLPEGWSGMFRKSSVKLSPGELAYNTLTLTPPKEVNETSAELTIVCADASNSKHASVTTFTVDRETDCGVPPLVSIDSTSLVLQTRMSVSTTLHIQNRNPPHCIPSTILLYTKNPRVALVPPNMVVLPGETKDSVLMYTSSMESTKSTVNDTVVLRVQDAFNYTNFVNFNILVQINTTDCVPAAPYHSLLCPPRVDNSTNGFNCYLQLKNMDTWPCPTTNWRVNITTVPPMPWNWLLPPVEDIPLFPLNGTGWVKINFTMPDDADKLEVYFGGVDTTDSSLNKHSFQDVQRIDVGQCERNDPTVDSPTYTSIQLGETQTFSFSITNNDNNFCDWAGVEYTHQSPVATTFIGQLGSNQYFDSSFSSVSLQTGQTKQMTMKLTAKTPQLKPPFNTTYNVTLKFLDPPRRHWLLQYMLVDVDPTCSRTLPTLTISPNSSLVPIGKSQTVSLTVNLTNNDVGNCTAATWTGTPSVQGTFPSGWKFSPSSLAITVEQNETKSVQLNVTTRENLGEGNYRIALFLSDSASTFHGIGASANVVVDCPKPRPVRNIVATPIVPFFSFGLQAGPVFLSWEACVTGLWCCCPCKYRIERNGEVIGVSDYTNFTDSANLRTGVRYVYTITTIDRNGIESSPNVCDNTIAFDIEPPSVRVLIIFLLSTCGGLFGLFLMVWTLLYVLRLRIAKTTKEEVSFIPDIVRRGVSRMCKPLLALKETKKKPLLELRDVLDDDEDEEEAASLLEGEEKLETTATNPKRTSQIKFAEASSDKPELIFGDD